MNNVDTSNSSSHNYEVGGGRGERRSDGSVKLRVYRTTHTNQYLSFKSHHPLHQKLEVVRTLLDRCANIVTEEQEKDTIRGAFGISGYPTWCMKKVEDKIDKKNEDKNRGMVVIPYIPGASERILKTRQVSAMRPHTTRRGLLVHPKDKTYPKEGVYRIDCEGCEKVYMG